MSDAPPEELQMLRRENLQLRDRIELLEREFMGASLVFPVGWGLRATEQRILAILLTRPIATKDQLASVLRPDAEGDLPNPTIVESHVCKLRKKLLQKLGIRICSERFVGYWIDQPYRSDLINAAGGHNVRRAA